MRHRSSHQLFVPRCALSVRTVYICLLAALLASISQTTPSRALDIMTGSQQGLIATGLSHTCALTKTSDAGVRCWGANGSGQLGDGTAVQRTSPVDVVGLSSGVVSVGVGNYFSCALLAIGEVRCWGTNAVGQLGNSNYATTQVPVAVLDGATSNPLTGVVSLSVGGNHACVVLGSGGAKCWGANNSGQLGIGNTSSTVSPTDVAGFTSNVKTIDAGLHHTCLASISPNRIYCFGSNADFQLGDATGVDSSVPILVSGYSNAMEVTAGDSHSCARLIGGDVICWGNNVEGELGDGTALPNIVPVTVAAIGYDGERVVAGTVHTCATRASDGEVLCWGRGAEGQIGDGSSLQRNSPTSANPSVKGAVDVSSGGSHTCAWMGPCNAKCWGSNTNGQIGNGTTTSSANPASITVCPHTEPTPTPTPTPLPDACASESACVPDDRLTTPLDPRPPLITVRGSTSQKSVTVNLTPVKLGVPYDTVKRETLRRRLSKFLNYKVKNLGAAIRSLRIYYIVSIVKAPGMSAAELQSLALPTKYRTETRNRRVSTRLGPGTYVARVTVRIKDSRGRTFVTGKRTSQTNFTVR